MSTLPKAKAGGAKQTRCKPIILAEYSLLRFFANIFGAAFSFFEERSYDLAERLENWSNE